MASSMQAASHMDPSNEKNLELFKNSEFENINGLFGMKRMMIEGNSKIMNVLPADVAGSLGKQVLQKEQTIKWTKARVYVNSDSVLCLGKQHGPEDAIRRWNDHQVSTLKMCLTFRELQGSDGDPIDFEWIIIPGAKALDILLKNLSRLTRKEHHT